MSDLTCLIDSDWTADNLKGRQDATALVNRLAPDGTAIRVVTHAEIYEGIFCGSDPTAHEASFRAFLRIAELLQITRLVARRFARGRGSLRQQGLLIPQADLFIAATALHHDLSLVTRNRRHYDRIPNLTLYP